MTGDEVAAVMLVCTGNIARSPLAEVLLQDLVQQRGLGVWVRSCGIHARPGEPAVQGSREEARARGLDLSAHRSRAADPRELGGCDLVLTMTLAQRRRLAEVWPEGVDRTFTLRGFVVLLEESPPPVPEDAGPAKRLRAALDHLAAVGGRRPGDIEDPYFLPREAYRRLADDLERLLVAVADLLAG